MKKLFKSRMFISVSLSVVLTFAFVYAVVYGATTISTNIETAGTLTVTGASTFGDEAADINWFKGTIHATSTALFTGVATHYETVVLRDSSTAGTATEGGIYYDSDDMLIKLYDGTSWVNVATSTGEGLTVSGSKLQLDSLNSYLTIGTTTQQGLSILTVEATSTAAIPLTIVARSSQTANLFQVNNSGSSNLFYINASGNVFATGTLQVTGAMTTYSTVTAGGNLTVPAAYSLDTAAAGQLNIGTTTANAIKIGKLGVTTTFPGLVSLANASSTLANFGDGTTVARILHGVCTLKSYAGITATSTGWHDCAVTGVTTDDRVLIQLPKSGAAFGGLYVAASRASTTAGYIGADILNLTGVATTSYSQATTSVQYWVFK